MLAMPACVVAADTAHAMRGPLTPRPLRARFIATVDRVRSEAAAKQVVEQVRRQMPTATHHAYAWRIDDTGALSVRSCPVPRAAWRWRACAAGGGGVHVVAIPCFDQPTLLPPAATWQHCDDDREVKSTAGPPILARLEGEDLVQTVVVVTRYYGGTQLGRGGLVRAYGAAASAGLEAAGVQEVWRARTLAARCLAGRSDLTCPPWARACAAFVRYGVVRLLRQVELMTRFTVVCSPGSLGRVRSVTQRLRGAMSSVEDGASASVPDDEATVRMVERTLLPPSTDAREGHGEQPSHRGRRRGRRKSARRGGSEAQSPWGVWLGGGTSVPPVDADQGAVVAHVDVPKGSTTHVVAALLEAGFAADA